VFALSAAIAGVGGVMFGALNKAANVNDFRLENGLIVLLLAVLGGVTTVSGALVGGAILAALTTQDQGVVFMLIAAGTVLLGKNPNGLAFFASERFGRLVRRSDTTPSPSRARAPVAVGSTG
jgi:branched-chain amino acid transport system permease protein